MVQPRDYWRYLRADVDAGTSPGDRAALLPPAPRAAQLWLHAGLLLSSALLPFGLWWSGRLAALDLILLYLAEGATYSVGVAARIAWTAVAMPGQSRLRIVCAYLLGHSLVWGLLAMLALASVAPRPTDVTLLQWLQSFLLHFAAPGVWGPAAATALFLALDVFGRGDYIDAYLVFGPRTVARYGFVYPHGLVLLLFGALLLWVPGHPPTGGPLFPPAFLALWIIGLRSALHLGQLTLPVWGRAADRATGRLEAALRRRQRGD